MKWQLNSRLLSINVAVGKNSGELIKRLFFFVDIVNDDSKLESTTEKWNSKPVLGRD